MKSYFSIKPGATFFLGSSQTLVYHKDDAIWGPVQFTKEQELKDSLANENLRVLMASKSCSESFTEEELRTRQTETREE